MWEEDWHQWAKEIKELLEDASNAAGGLLKAVESEKYLQKYRTILRNAEGECPRPDET